MRTILVISVIGFVLMVASLQAAANRFVLNERHLAQVKTDPNQGRSAEVLSGGAKDQSQSQPRTTNKGSSNSDAKHDVQADDNANESYGNKPEQELNSMGQISKLQILEWRVFDFIRILDGNQLLLCMCVCIEPFMLFC
ncbi:PREDICTED: uncharacterized protein LOC101306712 [Fragaria vesca subsp. vesca]